MEFKDLSNYLKPEESQKPSADLDIDLDALNFDVDENAIEAKRAGGGEAIVPTVNDNTCDSGGCIL